MIRSQPERVMKIQDLSQNLKSLSAPKNRQDVILLLQMACDEMDALNADLAAMNSRANGACLEAA